MAKRDNGTGTIYQRSNGNWVGKIYLGRDSSGKEKFKYLSGKTQAEVKRKIKEYNQNENKTNVKKVSVGEYVWNWVKLYKKGSIKDSSYDRIEDTIRKHIIPNIGMIQLQQLSSDDIQRLINNMKDKQGYSYSSIKKVYDCLNQVLTHAAIKDDITKNPILLVKMPDKRQFVQKEIKFFNKHESALIIEEATRTYRNGKPMYV